MSADKFQKDMIQRLLAELMLAAPTRVPILLSRHGFKFGDVSFMFTDRGRCWTEVWRWPWENRSASPPKTHGTTHGVRMAAQVEDADAPIDCDQKEDETP